MMIRGRFGGANPVQRAAVAIGVRWAPVVAAAAAAASVVKPSTAALRLAADRPGLLPGDSALPTFAEWLVELGETVAEDEFMAMYDDVAELAGWPIDIEPVAAPPLTVVKIAPVPPPPGVDTLLPPDVAAARFAEWVRLAGRCGTYNSEQLTALYSEHCADQGLLHTPENFLRKALKALPGVHLEQGYGHHPGGGRKSKRRHRPMLWTIAALDTRSAISELPWPELPDRKAA